ncbi:MULTISPECIES: C1 family peptidase [Arthrobacter]|uniref:aminopeptidase C n=1 Tax=Arthrobacter TaxID=1663 RepID=UPI000535E7A1|nr:MULTISPECIES: C1 family peptidase [Arthrobacter]AIY03743.1 aminopeptidase [Arthrobacter sp. PAMC 25486]
MSTVTAVTTSPLTNKSLLTAESLATMRDSFAADPVLKRTQNAIARVSVDDLAIDHQLATALTTTVSHRIDDWKVTNQKKSGRCWLFAALNLLRVGAKETLGVKEFEFSQNHAMYFDKLERANYFLASVLETADRPEDDRLVAHLLRDVMGDGGQWDMAVNIFSKYGAVPKSVMPETESSSNTGRMNAVLCTLLRRGAGELRALTNSGDTAGVQAASERILSDAHRILTLHLGTPPTSFEWEYTDDDKVFHHEGTLTPQEFLAKYTTINLEDYVCLVDDPRAEHPKGGTLTVEHLGNVVGAAPVLYLNVDIDLAKRLAKEAILDGEPVWFGCDVGPQMVRQEGIWDAELYDYAGLYGAELAMDKETRVRFGASAMTHAMLLTGVDVFEGRTRRWRVENSWGDESGDKGYYTMADNWFDEYVFEVVVDKKRLSPELQQALGAEATVLPAWDPMGALA